MDKVRRFYRVFRWILLGAVVVVIVLLLRTSSPPAAGVDPQAARRLESKLQRFAADGRAGQASPLRLDEAELNSWVRESLARAAGQSNVRDLRVHLEGDRATVYALFDLHGKDMSLTLEGRPSVQDGRLRLAPTRMLLGSLPLPRAAYERSIAALFDSEANRDQLRLPPGVSDVRVENGELVITRR